MERWRLRDEVPARLTDVTSWHTHLPFAFWCMEALRPRLFVELGTHRGDSYCSFCQAVDRLGLETRCFAVDTWRGDHQAGPYGEKVFHELQPYHDARYGRFSRLVRSTFDDARRRFEDGSIDLLHIDGLHTYEAVRHDFEQWLPAMSRSGVILFHDIEVREQDFGVWRLWAELRARYPSFTFLHGYGLGVLVVGPDAPEAAKRLAACDGAAADRVRATFEELGKRAAASAPGRPEDDPRTPAGASPGRSPAPSGAGSILSRLRIALRRWNYARLIRRSGLFDAGFYRGQCPDDPLARRRPVRHYLERGAALGLDPNPFFDTSFYVERCPAAAAEGKNPLVHFIRHGARERRSTSQRFDTAYYLVRHRDVAASGLNPLAHYLSVGAAEGRVCLATSHDRGPVLGNALDVAADLLGRGRARRILVVDQRAPTPDQDSGSVRMFAILKLLRRLGHEITFVADGDGTPERYARDVQELGVDVLQGFTAAAEQLASRGGEYAYVLLSRPQIAERYLTAVRAYALRAQVVYDTVDLHWVRFERAAEVTGDEAARREAARYRQLERINTACADLTLSVTPHERDLLLQEVPGARVEVLPNIHACEPGARPWQSRKDLLFIGGFDHAPNVDAVEWFAGRVLPLVHRELPGVVLQVVGSRMADRVRRLDSPSVRVLGHVPSVAPVFDAARVFVTPLRFGAGMKGKVGQSMALGLPVVTTTVGAEGMLLAHGENALVADGAEAFAAAVVRLYTDELLWSRIARASVAHVRSHFSEEVALEQLARLFPASGAATPEGETRDGSGPA